MLSLDHRLLIGPLYNPAVIGRYAADERIRLFMPESAHSKNYAYDLIYDPLQIRHFNELLAGLGDWEPDLVIWWDPVYQPIPPGLEDCPYPLALIPGDWNLAFGTVLQTARAVDGVFADARLGPILRRAGIANLHEWPGFAYDSSQVYAEPGLERIHDVCFIGNMNPNIHPRRSRYLAELLKLQQRWRLFLRHGVWGRDYRQALNQSRIVLNYTICQVMNMRAYEAPACGALLFIESDNREVRSIFRDRESCVLYDDGNLLELLEYYLSHEDERAAIAAAGQQIVANYNYEKHFERLLVQIPALLAGKPPERPIFAQPPSQRYICALNQISASNAEGAAQAGDRLFALWNSLTVGVGPERVWELNALLVMLFPHIDEQQALHPLYSISLADLLQGFETALALDANHPVLRYHHGLVCEYLADETQALWSYSRSIELMAGGRTADLLACRDFILPFNKSGRGTDQLAFEWERIGYESLEQGISPIGDYVRLLSSSIWQRIGRILIRQGRFDKALIAFHNAHQNFPRASLLLEIAKLQLRDPHRLGEAFATCLEMLALQPLMMGALPELITAELLLREAAWIFEQTDRFLALFPELDRLRQLAALVLAAHQGPAYDWRALLGIPFSADFYQWLCRILQRCEDAPGLKAMQILRRPWELSWELPLELAPELPLACGMFWGQGERAFGPRPTARFQRVYAGDSDLARGRCGPDLFPFLFQLQAPAESPAVDELLQGAQSVILAILAGWSPSELRELLMAFEVSWGQDADTLLVLSCPPGSGLSLADLEAALPPNPQAQIAWVDEPLSPPDQAALLQRAARVLTSPNHHGLYYSYWAKALEVPVAWIAEPGWLPDGGTGGFGLPRFQGPAQALRAELAAGEPLPRHWTHAGLRLQAWLNGLWQLRLWSELA